MSKWEHTTITQQGQDMLDKLIAGGTAMNITRAVVGSGTVNATKLAMQTDVTDPVREVNLGHFHTENGAVTIPVIITNVGLKEGYTAKQIGVYAQTDDGEEILFFIAQSDTKGLDIPSENQPPHSFTAEYEFVIDTGVAHDLTITVNASGFITVTMADRRYEKKAILKKYEITPEMFEGEAFPFVCTLDHGLGGEPSSAPLVDLDITSYTTVEDIEAVERSYGFLYRASFNSTEMKLYAKEIPYVCFTVIVKAVV